MKKTPLIIAIFSTIILFTLLGLLGLSNIYALEEQDILTTPVLSRVFTGFNNEHYPWQLFSSSARKEAKAEVAEIKAMEEEMLKKQQEEELAALATPVPTAVATPKPTATPVPTPTPSPTPMYPEGRYEPLSESTYEEYVNHISADIYGDMGVLRAATYEFSDVDITYFDDALFIGDSRTVGLRNYTELPEHADFLCETSLTIWDVFKSNYKGSGTVEQKLSANDYSKIYIMIGVNELGTGTTEKFMEEYTYVIDRIHELEPDAIIFIQAIMNIDRERSTTDKIYNNENIMARNHAIATLADNKTIFYIDENEAVTDEEGFLRDDLRGDHLHLKGESNKLWLEFLLSHGVVDEKDIQKP